MPAAGAHLVQTWPERLQELEQAVLDRVRQSWGHLLSLGAADARALLAQEMLRETNTIGSKCLDGEVSRRIVSIKGSIDRLKEQVQNIR